MSYYTKITKAGLAEITAAMNNSSKVPITYMAFGDGNGSIPEPDENANSLVNEVYRVGVNKVEVHNKNPNWLVCEAIIPSAVGGFNIREVALYDSTGNTMLAIASYPPTYKPTVEEGAAKIQTIRIILQVDNTGNFELLIDPDVVLATTESVNLAKKEIFEGVETVLKDISELNNIEVWENRTVTVKSYREPTNLALANPFKGGGQRIYKSELANQNDGGLVINGWVLSNISSITPEHFGAFGDAINDDTDMLQAALDCSISHVELLSTYKITKPLVSKANLTKKITGTSSDLCKIVKVTNTTSGILEEDGGATLDVDAILILDRRGYENNYTLNYSGFSLEYLNNDEVGWKGIGIYSAGVALSSFHDIRINFGRLAVHFKDSWMNKWTRVTGRCSSGWKIDSGTSNHLDTCWVIGRGAGVAYTFNNLLYSTMTACGCDYFGWQGDPGHSMFEIKWSNILINTFGYEKCHLNRFAYIQQSTVIFNNIQGLLNSNYNIYPSGTTAWIDNYGSNVVLNNCDFGLKYSPNSNSEIYHSNANPIFCFMSKSGDSLPTLEINNGNILKFYKIDNIYLQSGFLKIDIHGETVEKASGNDTNSYQKSLKTYKEISSSQAILSYNGFGGNKNPDQVTKTGFYHTNNYPESKMNHYFLVHCQHNISNDHSFQIGTPAGSNSIAGLSARIKNNGIWQKRTKIYNEDNTTVSADGTLKSASPIIRLFSDHIEFNDEAAVQEPIFEKVNTGHYFIKNTLGFAQQGWWINVPSDSNGNKMCAIKYQTLESGDIEVKTFKRKFDIETASIIADQDSPIDIPDNINGDQRWIDIRLHQLDDNSIETVI